MNLLVSVHGNKAVHVEVHNLSNEPEFSFVVNVENAYALARALEETAEAARTSGVRHAIPLQQFGCPISARTAMTPG